MRILRRSSTRWRPAGAPNIANSISGSAIGMCTNLAPAALQAAHPPVFLWALPSATIASRSNRTAACSSNTGPLPPAVRPEPVLTITMSAIKNGTSSIAIIPGMPAPFRPWPAILPEAKWFWSPIPRNRRSRAGPGTPSNRAKSARWPSNRPTARKPGTSFGIRSTSSRIRCRAKSFQSSRALFVFRLQFQPVLVFFEERAQIRHHVQQPDPLLVVQRDRKAPQPIHADSPPFSHAKLQRPGSLRTPRRLLFQLGNLRQQFLSTWFRHDSSQYENVSAASAPPARRSKPNLTHKRATSRPYGVSTGNS